MKKGFVKGNKVFNPGSFILKTLSGPVVFSVLFFATGCVNKNPVDTSTDTNPPVVDTGSDTSTENQKPPVDSSTDVPPVENDITFEEFLNEHSEIAENFAEDTFNQISYIDDALSSHYSFVEKDGKIEKVLVANVVKTGETERELKIATINIIPAVEIEDIVDDSLEGIAVAIESETVLTFDAKENYINGTNEELTSSISDLITQHLGEEHFTREEYAQEEFVPQTVAELVADYGDKVNEILNEKCMEKIIQRYFPEGFDSKNIQDAKWQILGETEITGAKLFIQYERNDTYGDVQLINIELKNNISLKKIQNLSNEIVLSKVSLDYFFSYVPSEKGTRNDLINAIFEANGMSKDCPEGAIRLFKDEGAWLDINGLGETNEFIVVQISNDKIIEFNIIIKQSASDESYIEKLNDSSNYDIANEKEIDLIGQEIPFTVSQSNIQSQSVKIFLPKRKEEFIENVMKNL